MAERDFASGRASGCGIAVMAKASTPGLTKTRLVPPLRFEEAAAFNTAFLQDVAANIVAAGRQVDITGYVAFGPPGSEAFFERILGRDIGLISAWRPNFGDCLLLAIEATLARGHSAAVVLNSDSPTLPTSLLVKTAEVLARPGDCAVLGPSTDGGYYLLGLKQAHQRLFQDITWSTEQVAEQTLERAREIGLDVHILPEWYDVDDLQSLRMLHEEIRSRAELPHAHTPALALHTTALIDRLCRESDFGKRVAQAQFEAVPG
ncbi:MAG TPA: TIGR04282 family arsenosugar biosynthesis glycosyltransferase [Pseudolabrys sp.]|nr:TIGR04282 family arsenosugar biosynthesis glycosyltransferase [Pseudolabrys sp.]